MSGIMVLDQLIAWRGRAPDALAAQEGSVCWSITRLLHEATRAAQAMAADGVTCGDRVAWCGHSSLDFAAVLLGTWMLDATYVGINPRYTHREADEVIERTGPRLVVTPEHCSAWRDRTELRDDAVTLPPPQANRPALLVFTSGTTGRPRIAVISHRAIAAASATQAAHTSHGATRTINALPANHIGGVVNITTATWWGWQAVHFVPVFSPAVVIDALRGATDVRLAGVPTLFRRCLDDPAFADAARGRVVHALSGGAPLPRSVHDELTALGVHVQGMYGQSEMSGAACFTAPDDDAETTCVTVGRPPVGVELRLGALDGSSGALREGEIQLRGPQLFDGYLDDPDATAQAFTSDGWLRSGDLGEQRADGSIRITGRLKEIINTGGHKVMPGEVEAVLHAHPVIRSAAVVATTDPVFGEAVAAAVVLRDEATIASADLDGWCRARLANYKVPKRWIQLAELPLLGLGKVDRKAVARAFAEGAGG
jgi:acyl-CoA synthetase (AMP-forming)/AMP-acid ligase II